MPRTSVRGGFKPAYQQDSDLMRKPGVAATENNVMLMVGYIGDPSSGNFDTGTAVNDP